MAEMKVYKCDICGCEREEKKAREYFKLQHVKGGPTFHACSLECLEKVTRRIQLAHSFFNAVLKPLHEEALEKAVLEKAVQAVASKIKMESRRMGRF